MSKKVVNNGGISVFQKYLTVWVILCMIIGILIGSFFPAVPEFLNQFEYANVSVPMAVLIWLMIYPMMMKVDFQSIKNVGKNPKGLFVTWIINWLIKPFTMYGIASLFFFVLFKAFITPELATEYLAGAVLLGAAPCTAMVFVWSTLTNGDPAYTVVQVATNDLIILFAFVPIVKFLLGVSDVSVPFTTLVLSVILFVVIPLAGGMLTRFFVINKKGKEYFEIEFVHKFDHVTSIGLLLTLIMIFSFQGNVILQNPLHIVLIAVPLVLQTFFVFAIAYITCYVLKLPHRIAAPAGMIGASNFFELAVAVAIALFGTASPAALATTVGVLTEVPVMLFLVKIANKTKHYYKAGEYDKYEGKPKVAFVCVHNSCRSQIAEALGKKLASDVFESYSAGTELKDHINQDAVRMMKKLHGIDMEKTQYSKLVTDIPKTDVVIFMGCNVNCPLVPGQDTENWGLDDPTGQSDEVFEETIRTIESNILQLKERLK